MNISQGIILLFKKYGIVGVVILAGILRIIHISFPFGDYDEGVYIATVESMIHGHPLYTSTYGSQFPLLFYISVPLLHVFHSIVVLRMIPIIASLITLVILYKLISKFIDWKIALGAAIYLSCNSIFLLVSRTYQLDMLWLCFTTCSFYFLCLFCENNNLGVLSISALCFGLSILTKANILFLAVLISAFIYLFLRDEKKVIIYASLYIGIVLLCFFLCIPFPELHALIAQSVIIRTHFVHQISILANKDTILLLINHEWPIFIVDMTTIIWWAKEKVQHKQMQHELFFIYSCIWLLTTAFIFIVYYPLFLHHLIYIMPPAVCVASYGLLPLIKKKKLSMFILVLFVFMLVYTTKSIISDKTILFPKETPYTGAQRTIAHYIKTNTLAHAYIITDDPILLYLAKRETTPQLVDTSFVRITSDALQANLVIKETQQYHINMVILVTGRLELLPEYISFLQKNFVKTTIAGYNVYMRNRI